MAPERTTGKDRRDDRGTDVEQALRRLGLSVTPQRLAVFEAVRLRPHSTAAEVFEETAKRLGRVSRQAVYDALGVLVECGLLRRIEPAGSPALYETRVGDNHHHVICRVCGRTEDVDCAVGRRPCLQPSDARGFSIDEAEVVYWGVCPSCATDSEESDRNTTHEEVAK